MRKQIYTPGPTEVHPEVLRALSIPPTNADLDTEFYEKYREQSDRISSMMKTSGPTLMLIGEAILGLEASLATYLNKGDKVITMANGIFGHGFADFAAMYGGNPVKIEAAMNTTDFDYEQLTIELEDADICTMVHCETPSGLLNPIEKVGQLCRDTDTLFVVDAVSSVFGTEMKMDEWGVDVLLGGTQKALSQPVGLTLISLSSKAHDLLEDVKETSSGYYANLTQWTNYLNGENWLPYSHSQPLINAMEAGLTLIEKEGLDQVYSRHTRISAAVRETITTAGLELYPEHESISSPTVTAYLVPDGIDDKAFRSSLWDDYGLMIGGSLGELKGKIQRLGHMGYQAHENTTVLALSVLEQAYNDAGFQTDISWGEYFLQSL